MPPLLPSVPEKIEYLQPRPNPMSPPSSSLNPEHACAIYVFLKLLILLALSSPTSSLKRLPILYLGVTVPRSEPPGMQAGSATSFCDHCRRQWS